MLHADDAVANKVCALFGRAEVRDYVDVAAILASGRYSEEDLVRLAEEHDPGFDPSWFAEALAQVSARIQHRVRKRREITWINQAFGIRDRAAGLDHPAARSPHN